MKWTYVIGDEKLGGAQPATKNCGKKRRKID